MGWIIGGVIALVVILLIAWFVSGYNSFIRLRNKTEEAYSSMDVYLKKRYDLIPNLVETVKGYASHEKETLERVVAARNSAVSAQDAGDRIQKDNLLQSALRGLFALSEAYPDLKANASFLDLQAQLRDIEDDIEKSRRFYNGIVNQYNTRTETFPSNLIASLFHFTRKPLYEVDDAAERNSVKVQF